MHTDYVEYVAETRKLVLKYSTLTADIDELLKVILLKANIGQTDAADEYRQKLEKILQVKGIYQAKANDIASMPVPQTTEGGITLGTVFQGGKKYHEFKTPLEDLNRHVGIFASSGHGKTVLIFNLIRQVMQHNKSNPDNQINFLIFDFKQDFRHLKEYPIVCLRWNWLRLNPFVPPEGMREPDWFNLVCNIFAHTFSWFFGSQYYLLEAVTAQHERVKENSYVRLNKVREDIEATTEKSYKKEEYRNVVLNRLTTVTQVLHEVLDCSQGVRISDLLNLPLIIELDGLDEGIANFLINLFLVYVMEYRRVQAHRGGLRHLIIFDEAHRVFYKASELRQVDIELGPSPTQQLPRVIRDFGEGLVFSSQEPSKINDSVIANADTKLVGYLGSGFDIEAVEHIFHLSHEDSEIVKKLRIGQFLAQKSGVNEGQAFLLETNDYPLKKSVTNAELADVMKDFIFSMQSEPKETGGTMIDYVKLPAISEEAQKMLVNVCENPFRGVSQRYKELHVHPLDGKKAVQELSQQKMVALKPIQLSAGRPALYLEPTELGKMWLEKNGRDLSQWNDYIGNVGLEHRVYQGLIGYGLRKTGHKVIKEYVMGGKRFDVYAEKLKQVSGIKVDTSVDYAVEKRLAVEVCISPKMNFFELEKVVGQLDEVVFACLDLNVLQIMQKELGSLGIDNPKYKFVVAHRYLTELYGPTAGEESKE